MFVWSCDGSISNLIFEPVKELCILVALAKFVLLWIFGDEVLLAFFVFLSVKIELY
ncbi:hypothetical protein [Campylobacter iguaniorum]|uniref:hypothetical protein n=1 Tax=Campylobacter iguaniorum TaxID=1244531 RepID=UPI000A7A8F80|nr:hypothetical protein [Campylobacter iguaniorum]